MFTVVTVCTGGECEAAKRIREELFGKYTKEKLNAVALASS
jgi:hypothetical protein